MTVADDDKNMTEYQKFVKNLNVDFELDLVKIFSNPLMPQNKKPETNVEINTKIKTPSCKSEKDNSFKTAEKMSSNSDIDNVINSKFQKEEEYEINQKSEDSKINDNSINTQPEILIKTEPE